MNIEKNMWEYLKQKVEDTPTGFTRSELKDVMHEIERKTLPDRVAEILRNADESKVNEWCISDGGRLGAMRFKHEFKAIIKALATGDLTDIEQWVK